MYSLAQQPDGKLLVAGSFSLLNGQAAPSVARLLLTGTPDLTFTLGTGPTSATGTASSVSALVVLSNGQVLVGGVFAKYNGMVRGRLARLNTDGTLDASFASGAAANNAVAGLAALAGGQALVAGSLTQYDGLAATGLVRVTAAGGADPTFAATFQARGTIESASALANGQFLISGTFSEFNGVPATSTAVRRLNADGNLDLTYTSSASALLYGAQADGSFYTLSTSGTQYQLQRVLPSGALDNTFTALPFGSTSMAGATSTLRGVTVQPDGRLLVFGYFTAYGGVARNSIARLNANGTLDTSFTPPTLPSNAVASDMVYAITLQPSGKLIITYARSLSGVGGNIPSILERLNTDGTLDTSFAIGTGGNGTGYFYFPVLAQPDGKLLISGNFTSFNGQATPYGAIRLGVDGVLDASFSGISSHYSFNTLQADGHILAFTGSYGTTALVRLAADGSRDNTFATVAIPTAIFSGDDMLTGLLFQPADGNILLYGSFRSVAGQLRLSLARLTTRTITSTSSPVPLKSLVVYPNPTSQLLMVHLPPAAYPLQATLFDLTGRSLQHWTLPVYQPETSLTVESIPRGVYVLRIPTTTGIYQQKIVVAH
ncbi:MAG: T9SS type A sorting domain-containing protein [Hymenobacter sp.]|nr:MAG: T9SS type A sorting domain-containing protein [Hymenobacter sp.]